MISDNWLPIIVIGFLVSFSFIALYGSSIVHYNSYVHNCIDNGGVPVSMMTYTKGYGDGYQCIEITRKVEIK